MFGTWEAMLRQLAMSLSHEVNPKQLIDFINFMQIVDLQDESLAPSGWANERPVENINYQHPSDMSVYELHIRDFSILDETVPEEHRGKYTAFAQSGSGSKHLSDLQEAGLTHIHLLPSYDFGSVPERKQEQKLPEASDPDTNSSIINCKLDVHLNFFKCSIRGDEADDASQSLRQAQIRPCLHSELA